MVSAYWNDIEFKRKEYTDVVADLCSRAINVSTCDVLLYSFGCRFKEFIDGYTLKLTEATKQTTLSKISKRFHEIVRKKVYVVECLNCRNRIRRRGQGKSA